MIWTVRPWVQHSWKGKSGDSGLILLATASGGANGSSIVVTALDSEADLQLAIDWNGDTVVDETRLMAWDTVPGW